VVPAAGTTFTERRNRIANSRPIRGGFVSYGGSSITAAPRGGSSRCLKARMQSISPRVISGRFSPCMG
jgi:hypothetical protein